MTETAEKTAVPPKPGPKSSNWRRAVRVALVGLSLVVAWTWIKSGVYGAYTRSFVDQMNQIGRTLKPGQVGTVRVPSFLADEIILLAPYSPWGPAGAMQSNEECLLLWLKHRRVVTIVTFPTSSLRFVMDGDSNPPKWRIDPHGEIRVEVVHNPSSKGWSGATLRLPGPNNLGRVIETSHEVDKP